MIYKIDEYTLKTCDSSFLLLEKSKTKIWTLIFTRTGHNTVPKVANPKLVKNLPLYVIGQLFSEKYFFDYLSKKAR